MFNIVLLLILPLFFSLILFLLPANRHIRRLSLIVSFLPLFLLIYGGSTWIGSQIKFLWFSSLSIEFYLKVDSLALIFLFLTTGIIPIAIFALSDELLPFQNLFYSLIFLLEALLVGFFTARDLALFTFFWEAMLVPLYFIILLWGGSKRQEAALKFIIYMISGSVLMIISVLILYFNAQTFNLDILEKIAGQIPFAGGVFAIFLLAFAVKTPLFPFHAWLPDAYSQAPTSGTILLSALLSKAGIYGTIRIGIELFPLLISDWGYLLGSMALAGVFYGGLSAWYQIDFKNMIIYASLSHVNFILVGLFMWNETAHIGAVLQTLNHGITIAALFLISGWLEKRLGTTSLRFGGIAKYFPQLCWVSFFFVLSAIALPGTNNFVGELLIFFGLFGRYPWIAALLVCSTILSAMYMLRWMQKIYFEQPLPYTGKQGDLTIKEWMMALSLIVLILWIGIYPSPFLKKIQSTTNQNIYIETYDGISRTL